MLRMSKPPLMMRRAVPRPCSDAFGRPASGRRAPGEAKTIQAPKRFPEKWVKEDLVTGRKPTARIGNRGEFCKARDRAAWRHCLSLEFEWVTGTIRTVRGNSSPKSYHEQGAGILRPPCYITCK